VTSPAAAHRFAAWPFLHDADGLLDAIEISGNELEIGV
jgi:hypothetical protein